MVIKQIIIHCSDTPNGRWHTAKDIHQWHLNRNWDGIGYHYVIKLDGIVENGRPEYWMGSHAKGRNRDSIGICLIGKDKYTGSQWIALINLLKECQGRHPNSKIIGHNEISHKTCPGFNVQDFVKKRISSSTLKKIF